MAKRSEGASPRQEGADAEPSPAEARIGVRIRHARMTAGLRLKDVAAKADCSESLLSKIENDKIVPSLLSLRRVAAALGLTLGELFATANEPERVVLKAGERPVTAFDPLRRGTGVRLERLIPYGPHHLLQGNIHIIAQGGGSDGTVHHAGEEVGYVLEGEIELTVDGKAHVLEAGDSFCFRSEQPHGYRNLGRGEARILFINTPPTF
jgi:quercetin dioxygenase-like cupin family protein/DNA-binding XRE family transcriptional regulator